MQTVSILTRSTLDSKDFAKLYSKYIVKSILTFSFNILIPKKYGGHAGVTKSLIDGFKTLKVTFNYNPKFSNQLHDTVIVLSGIDALAQCIQLKRSNRIKTLLAGPNLCVLPSDHQELFSNEMIDICITNSNWTQQAFQNDMPVLKNKIKIWPAGVNEEYWKPKPSRSNRKCCLFYIKTPPPKGLQEYESITKKAGFDIIYLYYGKYKPADYKASLEKVTFITYFGTTESQGLALLEAWSMNIPSLVLEHTIFEYHQTQFEASSAPYLTPATGQFFKDIHQYKSILATFSISSFSPRNWVMNNMTNAKSSEKMLEILDEKNK